MRFLTPLPLSSESILGAREKRLEISKKSPANLHKYASSSSSFSSSFQNHTNLRSYVDYEMYGVMMLERGGLPYRTKIKWMQLCKKSYFVCLFWWVWVYAQNGRSCVGPLCLHTGVPVSLEGLDTAPPTAGLLSHRLRKLNQQGNWTQIFQLRERCLSQPSHRVQAKSHTVHIAMNNLFAMHHFLATWYIFWYINDIYLQELSFLFWFFAINLPLCTKEYWFFKTVLKSFKF